MKVFHRLAPPHEADLVERSGELWGKAKRLTAGNYLPSVKAFLGELPDGQRGYSFMTDVEPTHYRTSFGRRSAEWQEGAPGVENVPSHDDYVRIKVRVMVKDPKPATKHDQTPDGFAESSAARFHLDTTIVWPSGEGIERAILPSVSFSDLVQCLSVVADRSDARIRLVFDHQDPVQTVVVLSMHSGPISFISDPSEGVDAISIVADREASVAALKQKLAMLLHDGPAKAQFPN